MPVLTAIRALMPARRTIRIGVTGLARSGKTSLLTSLAVNLMAAGRGCPALPALSTRLAGARLGVRLSPSEASDLPRFDALLKAQALAQNPPHWPSPTDATSLLALDIDIHRPASLRGSIKPSRLRLEFLDYPGEWLLDLPLLAEDFTAWSQTTLMALHDIPEAAPFLAFHRSLPASVAASDAVAETGHGLYVACLRALQAKGWATLQPGRFLMPAPGAAPPWMTFFPMTGASRLQALLAQRYAAYVEAARNTLANPGFAGVSRLVVLADMLSALHAGPAAFANQAQALGAVAQALQRPTALGFLPSWLRQRLAIGGLTRVAFAATKADHVARAQRANLKALVHHLTAMPARTATASFALASIACTEDFVWTLEGRPVSAVRGHVPGQGLVRSYPGEVPGERPHLAWWTHDFLSLPAFSPKRLEPDGRGAIGHLALDELLVFLLEDIL
jgi:predicted YcjX-like family ATPase